MDEREKITIKTGTITLREMKVLLRNHAKRPIVSLDAWRNGRNAEKILRKKLSEKQKG